MGPGEIYSFNIIASPDNVSIGNYYADLNLNTGNVVYQKKLMLKIREGKTFFEKVSEFLYYWRYWFYTGIVVLILAIVLSFYLKEKARVWKIKKLIKNSIKKDREEKKVAEKKKAAKKKSNGKKKKSLKWLYYLITIIIIAAIVCLAVGYPDYCLLVLSYILSFIFEYIWYIIAGLLLAMIIISILNKIEK